MAMDIPTIELARIQAQVLVPLVKALREELGNEKADALVRRALAAQFRKFGEKWWNETGAQGVGQSVAAAFEKYAEGGALDYDVLKKTPEAFEMNITGCRYAEFYKKIGAPDLGFLLVCSADFDVAEGFGAGVKLTRTQTIMQGASHCDFRYALEKRSR